MTKQDEIETKPCGCTITTKPGGQKLFAPCVVCGLHQAGEALQRAGKALAAVATTISKNAANATLARATAEAMRKTR